MSTSQTVFAALDDLSRATFARRTVCYFAASQVWTCPADGWLVIRCLGAGGSGACAPVGSNYGASGGSAGTVGVKRVRVSRGDRYTVTIPAGGAGRAPSYGLQTGLPGGTLTVTGPGVSVSIPGAPGGVAGAQGLTNADAADPTGLDWFLQSARNVVASNQAGGGAAAALQVGGASQAASGEYGANVMGALLPPGSRAAVSAPLDASHCWLLVDVSGSYAPVEAGGNRILARSGVGGGAAGSGYGAGFGAGGQAGQRGNVAGDGGTGGGGGGLLHDSSAGAHVRSGAGGAGFVTFELLEAQP